MKLSSTASGRLLRCGPLLMVMALMVGGCTGMEPYEARDEREEGPKQGLFSGSNGEFVIVGSQGKPDSDKQKEKKAETTSR
jgi:hypothetical protein